MVSGQRPSADSMRMRIGEGDSMYAELVMSDGPVHRDETNPEQVLVTLLFEDIAQAIGRSRATVVLAAKVSREVCMASEKASSGQEV